VRLAVGVDDGLGLALELGRDDVEAVPVLGAAVVFQRELF
jgi:hypothetical protein